MAELNAVLKKPFAEQVAFFRNKLGNLVPTAKWDDLQKAQHDTAFMVAGAQKADLLADLSKSIDKAISQGAGLEAWRKDFKAAVEEYDWHGWMGESTETGRAWRTRVTYQTNMQTSYAAGRFAQLQEGGFEYWVYHHSDGVKVPREQHLAWDGMALPADHPFWQTHYPPNGWGCQCYVTGARNKDIAEMHGADFSKTPPEGTEGIHKGWDYAPGANVAKHVSLMAEKAGQYPHAIAANLLTSLAASKAFESWYNAPVKESLWPIAKVDSSKASLIGAQTTIVSLSQETAIKQTRAHPELQASEYQYIQKTITGGWNIQDGENSLIFVLENEGYVSVVKSTKTGKGLFLTSFRRLSSQAAKRDEEIKRLRKKENR